MADASDAQDRTFVKAAQPARTLGRYTVLAKLATGGMAEIFLARQTGAQGFEKLVALKQILPSFSADPDFVEMFIDEARIAAQLSHPNIVQIFDLGEQEGTAFIAMEYLAGESLSALARAARKVRQPVPLPIAVRLISQAAEALDYAHRKTDLAGRPMNIVHRDVSPQNLFVTYDGAMKVLDFGIAKAANRASHTMDGQVKGKLAYMSPEQARGQPLDARSDVWALGVVLHELVCDARLFTRDAPSATFLAITGDAPIPRPRELNPQVPAEVEAAILGALERDPDRRTATAGALHEQLEAWLRTADYPSAARIGELMQRLFAERIRTRAALVDRASRGEEISSVSRHDTESSMPGGTPASGIVAPQRPLWIWLVPAVVLAGLAGAVLALRPRTAPEQVVVKVAAPRPPEPTLLHISTDPPHAVVVVDGVDHGPAPIALQGLAVGTHHVQVRLAGRPNLDRDVALDRAGQSLDVVLSLPPPTPPPPAAKPAEEAEKPRRVVRMGKLTLQTIPWTHVYLGSKSLGDTPLVQVALPAGTHQLRLENREKNVQHVIEVTIAPDQVTTMKLHL